MMLDRYFLNNMSHDEILDEKIIFCNQLASCSVLGLYIFTFSAWFSVAYIIFGFLIQILSKSVVSGFSSCHLKSI